MSTRFFCALIISSVVVFGCSQPPEKPQLSEQIRLNQIGYYPNSTKEFIVADLKAESFKIINETGQPVLEGKLVNQGTWDKSGETVLLGDFTTLQAPGRYSILLDDKYSSYPFEVTTHIYDEALRAAIKSYYFQRASMEIAEEFGGIYTRAAGHPDNPVKFHLSSGYTEGSKPSPGGWYDAGDYGKYVINAAFSVGQMLDFVEMYPGAIDDELLNIPESGNGVSDLLDELRYELNWIQTMQDDDGGVFFKLTAEGFSGFIMPNEYDLERLIIGKSTASSLYFAAIMAQAGRVYSDIDPNWSTQILEASQMAWGWAIENNDIVFSNPEGVNTGEYGDGDFSDDFYWAATELYLSTGEEEYLDYLRKNALPIQHKLTNSWAFFVANNAFHSMLNNQPKLPEDILEFTRQGQLNLADSILLQIESNPYNIALERYEWGSNSDIFNQAMILCFAHALTQDAKYLIGVERITDYIFGKNATGFSFLTGFGSKQAMFPHHRPSGADGIEAPVPGFVIGGPNEHQQDIDYVKYNSNLPAKSYEDVEGSFASNEVCLNWNSCAVFVLGYLEQVK